jgi:4-hydroxybenzoate polyprenyltransferase
MGYLRMIRPLNCTIALIAVFVGAWIGKKAMFDPRLLCAGVAAFLVCAFGNVVNDLKDIEIDKINNPRRPLPSGLSFILGGIITRNPVCLVPFVFSFLIHTPREILKDVIDMEGDKAGGVSSLPIILGVVPSYRVSAFMLCCLCILLPFPYLLSLLGTAYLAVIVIGIYPLLVFMIVQLFRRPVHKDLPRYSSLLKVVMVIGLIGMIL